MELFSNIIKKYNIKCHNKLFQKIVLEHFNIIKHSKETIHIGLNMLPDDVKKFKKHLYVLLIGPEIFNLPLMEFLVNTKEKISFFTLSIIDQNYYRENYNINSKIIIFDFPPSDIEKNKKILYFYKCTDINDTENNKDFNSYINNTNNLFCDVRIIKMIFLEPIKFIPNPYINIAITNDIPIEYINFYYISFGDVLASFKKDELNFMKKYYNYRINFVKVNNFIHLLGTMKKYILNKVFDEKLHLVINNIYDFKEPLKNTYIVFSDNFDYLKTIDNNIILKILIVDDDTQIIRKMDNNFIIINKYFFDEKVQEDLKKFHNKNKNFEFENKYTTYNEAKIYQFIIKKESEIELFQNYINLFNKYSINVPIYVFCPFNVKFNYNADIQYSKYSNFKIIDNSKIFHSPDFDMHKYFNNIVLKNNIEVKLIGNLNILVCSTQYPSYGGAATNAYNIIKYFKKYPNINTFGLFIDSCDDIEEKANPDNLDYVMGINYREFSGPDVQQIIVEKFGGLPDIAFCKNCMAPKLIKQTFPNCINIFLVSGIWGFSQIECGANEITDFKPIRRIQEEKSIELTNLILCNSNLTINYFQKIYHDIIQNKLIDRPIDTTKYNVLHQKYDNEKYKRDIDLIAIASNVNRPVKNLKFVKEILLFDKKLKKKKIVIIGENTEELFGDLKNTHNIQIISLIKQHEVEKYLKKSKVIIIPSLFDSNSNVFREAAFNEVIPFISCNVAHPQKYPNFLVLDNYDVVEWSYRINYAIKNYTEIIKKYDLTNLFKNNDDLIEFVF